MNTSVTVAELLQKIDAGEPMLLLDVRNDEEFARWRVEGRKPVETFHRPYFDYIEDESLVEQIPAGKPVYAICAKGDSSDYVAGLLRERGAEAMNVAGGMVAYGEYLQPVRVPVGGDSGAAAVPAAGRPVGTRGAPHTRTDDGFEIWQMNRRGKGCLSYVIRSGGEAVVVDPSRAIGEYEKFAERLGAKIVAVFDTHVHADHLSGGPALAPRHSARYFVAAGSGVQLRQHVDEFHDGDRIKVGGVTLTVRIMSTPGHTPGSTSLLVGKNHLLTGDTIFVESVGRPDLGGQVVEWGKMLFHTLREKIATLPDDTVILPAHYASTSEIDAQGVVRGRLGHLRRTVPELQIRSEAEFVEAMKSALKTHPDVYDHIIRVNLGIETVAEEKAAEWELGKNECAASVRKRMEAAR